MKNTKKKGEKHIQYYNKPFLVEGLEWIAQKNEIKKEKLEDNTLFQVCRD